MREEAVGDGGGGGGVGSDLRSDPRDRGGTQERGAREHWQGAESGLVKGRQREEAGEEAYLTAFEGVEEELNAIDEEDVFGHGGSLEQAVEMGEEASRGDKRRHESMQGSRCGAEGHEPNAEKTERSAWSHDRLYIAEAISTGEPTSAADARVGPGGPRAAGATVAVAPTVTEGATATVAAVSDGLAILQMDVGAREADAERGEADHGPPGGYVAPPEGDEGSRCHERQVLQPPLTTPSISGAGPRYDGLDGKQEVGEWSAKAKARRRDGVGRPAASGDGSVGRRHSSRAEEREEPDTGSRHHAPSARQSECSDVRVAMNAAGLFGDVAHRARCDDGGSAKRRRAARQGHHSVGRMGSWPSAAGDAEEAAASSEHDGHHLPSTSEVGAAAGRVDEGLQGHPRHRAQRRGGALELCGRVFPRGPRNDGGAASLAHDDGSQARESRGDEPRPCGTAEGRYTVGGSSSSDGYWFRDGAFDEFATSTVSNRGSESGGAGIAACRRPAPPRAELHQRESDDLLPTRHRRRCRGPAAEAGARPGHDEPLEAWRRPPAWLYLPHLGIIGQGVAIGHGEGPADAGKQGVDDHEDEGAMQEERTRPTTGPGGIGRVDRATAAAARAGLGGDGQQGPIRGRAVAPGREGETRGTTAAGPVAEGWMRGAAGIRGHGGVPGPAAGSESMEAMGDDRGERADGAAQLAAPGTRAADQRAAAEEERRARAQRRLDARNAGLATSLQDHAERVAKRNQAGDRPACATAKERVAALRRRIKEKARRQSEQQTEPLDPGGGVQQATGRAGDDAPVAGCGSQDTPPVGTTEVLKIHLVHDLGRRIQLATAWTDGRGGGTGTEGIGIAEAPAAVTPTANAIAAAACTVAWHTTSHASGGPA